MYLKITNAAENHHGLQYHDGLNIDPVPFAKEGSCCRGGIYFTTPEYICEFIGMGVYVREVTIPEDAEMVQDPEGNKWRASKVILGQRRDVFSVDTFEWLLSINVDITQHFLEYASYYGYLDVAKYLVEHGADIHADNDCAFRFASGYGHLNVVKYLIEHGADIHAENDCALRLASDSGQFEVVKYLVENGADIHACDDGAMKNATYYGHLDVVKYLVEHGSDIHSDNDYALKYASINGHFEVVKYLVESGADVHSQNYALNAKEVGHEEIAKYLDDARKK